MQAAHRKDSSYLQYRLRITFVVRLSKSTFSKKDHFLNVGMLSLQLVSSFRPCAVSPLSSPSHLLATTSTQFSTDRTVSLLTCDLGVVLEIAGGLSATALAFIVSLFTLAL